MIPNAHLFEGTADNYPFQNDLQIEEFEGHGLRVFDGAMVTVLGTSLQNKDIFRVFPHFFMAGYWSGNGRCSLPKSNSSFSYVTLKHQ